MLAKLAILLGLAACDAAQAPAVPTPPARAAQAPLRLERVAVHDPGIGCSAFTMLVPRGWKLEGGVSWQLQYANLASGQFRVRDPASAAVLEVFPVIPACWDPNLGPAAQGQNYMGSVVHPPPRDAGQYVAEVFVPLHRKQVRGLALGTPKALPDVARAVERSVQEAGVEKRVSAARVRLEYEDGGKAIVEDVFVTLVLARSPLVPAMTQWSLEHQYSFRAEKGRLDALEPLLQALVSSVRLELAWYAGYAEVQRLWRDGQMKSIRDAGEISRRIARNSDEILASMRSSWQARQESQDRMAREFGEQVRGVETYEQPWESRQIQLPSGYDGVWANAAGEYVFTNEAGFDPNVGSTVEWRRLGAAR